MKNDVPSPVLVRWTPTQIGPTASSQGEWAQRDSSNGHRRTKPNAKTAGMRPAMRNMNNHQDRVSTATAAATSPATAIRTAETPWHVWGFPAFPDLRSCGFIQVRRR